MNLNPLHSTTLETPDYVHWFRHAAPYINTHRGKTFVLMFGGEALLEENFQHIIHDVALLHALGIHLVLVHGARPQINENLKQLGLETPFYQYRRITTRVSLKAVLNAAGSIRLQIEALLSMGLANSPMYGARIDVVSGNFVTAKPYGIRDGIDFQLTGDVRSVDCEAIQRNLDNNNIVLLGPAGYSTTGEVFNLRAEDVAMRVACDLKADKLIFLGENTGILDQKQHLIRELWPQQAEQYLAHTDPDATGYLHVMNALYACKHGVNRCHLLSYRDDGALLGELFTRDGAGTLITDAHYEEVRQATIHDVGGLLNLLRPLEQQGILVYRSRERLESEIGYFAVIERDGTILACAALYPIPMTGQEQKSAEIACVAVHPDYRKSNRGAKVLEFLQLQARQQQIKRLFLLTTHTGHWFLEQGFEKVTIEDLPAARQAFYNFQRNSQVYCKILDD
ncbi:amino-acid N-acetyltransferase [Acinetobacter qingfengensis]|uniref:Amino-acid acetyltransferase n=1 Tax=Acinetobacter qingfengensis TaxID=1262585 RepID=A0A1E7QWP2_9GAMM|nr:amino-acid N-acetyltransferase [Acinetobacter qingfengensis]KAA8731242.1 amino-acid N-acetyltransferase [Acinetobacter qingfengensis]OEY91510.1 amino-acid N-acetyltransferase [Acinetobacter qingfengensis]